MHTLPQLAAAAAQEVNYQTRKASSMVVMDRRGRRGRNQRVPRWGGRWGGRQVGWGGIGGTLMH